MQTRGAAPLACAALLLSWAVSGSADAAQEKEDGEKEVSEKEVRENAGTPGAAAVSGWMPLDPEQTLYMDLPAGRVVIALAPAFAPNQVALTKRLVRNGFYDGLTFYRVIQGFVAQAGVETDAAIAASGIAPLKAELERGMEGAPAFIPLGTADTFAPEAGYAGGFPAGRDIERGKIWLLHCPGVMAIARDTGPDTGATEFYIPIGQAPRYLDRNLTVIGRVVAGLEHVQGVKRGVRAKNSGVIPDPEDRTPILKIQVAADVPETGRLPLEMLSSESAEFKARLAAARARDNPFFIVKPTAIDVCRNMPPVRMNGVERDG